uniref:Potassium channel domain-containing protein n=1 Tax=Amphora coffeiformis TaxID=265554 RepID=A0A6S8JS36_9STRA
MARRKRKTKAAFVTTSQTPTADVASSTEATTATTNKPVVATDHRSTSITTVLDDYLPVEPGMEDLSTARVLLMGAALLAVGTFGFYYIPGLMITPPNKDVVDSTNGNHHHHHHHHLIHAFYCASITLTTVGFGDICPGEGIDHNGKIFLLLLSLGGLGMFGGPILQLGAAWRHAIPGGRLALATCLLGLGVTIFTNVEGLSHLDAIYASVITGTTIGYGDITPQTDRGKIAVALYALVSVHAMAILLDSPRLYLEQLCRRQPRLPTVKKQKRKQA